MRTSQDIVDTIFQTAVVGVFSPHAVAVAPIRVQGGPADTSACYHLIGWATFTGQASSGSFELYLPPLLLDVLVGANAQAIQKEDLLRELTNQLSGSIKNRMLQLQLELKLGTPAVLDVRQRREPKPGPRRSYVFRTLRGDMVLILVGTIDSSRLVYSSSINVGHGGDVILF